MKYLFCGTLAVLSMAQQQNDCGTDAHVTPSICSQTTVTPGLSIESGYIIGAIVASCLLVLSCVLLCIWRRVNKSNQSQTPNDEDCFRYRLPEDVEDFIPPKKRFEVLNLTEMSYNDETDSVQLTDCCDASDISTDSGQFSPKKIAGD